MLSLIKKSLIWIVSGAATVILTACYGPMVDPCTISKEKIRTLDQNNEPIKGLLVTSALDTTGVYTDTAGYAEILMDCGDVTVTIEDVDGAENGSFESRTVELSYDEEPNIVHMDPVGTTDSDAPGLPDVN